MSVFDEGWRQGVVGRGQETKCNLGSGKEGMLKLRSTQQLLGEGRPLPWQRQSVKRF